jgi:hypothetical protein
MKRKDDPDQKTRFRSERLFLSQGQWFCNTREGKVLGPFARREDAVTALGKYLRDLGIRPSGNVWDEPGTTS